MKHLSNYTEQPQTELFKKCNAFFAFSDKQFHEQKKAGIKYVSLGAGIICDKTKVKDLINGLDEIQKAGIKKDLHENGKEAIIKRELYNYECFYVNDATEAIEALKGYNFKKEEILTVYYAEAENARKNF